MGNQSVKVIPEKGLSPHKIVCLYILHQPLLSIAWKDIMEREPTKDVWTAIGKDKNVPKDVKEEIRQVKLKVERGERVRS